MLSDNYKQFHFSNLYMFKSIFHLKLNPYILEPLLQQLQSVALGQCGLYVRPQKTENAKIGGHAYLTYIYGSLRGIHYKVKVVNL